MIIKSHSRKDVSFAQLMAYMLKDADAKKPRLFSRNLYSLERHYRDVIQEFERNATFLPPRQNGNVLYHEIIVLEKDQQISADHQASILLELAEKYCEMRAPGQLAFGCVHQNKDHQHIHLMLSANPICNKQRVRWSRDEFIQFQCDLEAYQQQHFPELVDRLRYSVERPADRARLTNREGEMVRRTRKPSRKQQVQEQVLEAIARSAGPDELQTALKTLSFELYQRGKHTGIRDLGSNKNYRLKTLGLEPAYEQMLQPQRSTSITPEQVLPIPTQAQPDAFNLQPVSTETPPVYRTPQPETTKPPATPIQDPRAQELQQLRTQLEQFAEDRLQGFDEELER